MRIFRGLCVNRIPDLDALRSGLKTSGVPILQASAAEHFLGGSPGDAWPVPDASGMGNLVLALPLDRRECDLFGRREPIGQAELEFVEFINKPLKGLVTEKKIDQHSKSPSGGDLHTLGYLWTAVGKPNAVAFFFSTDSSASADIQVKATEAIVSAP
jgi:hypothetical protein